MTQCKIRELDLSIFEILEKEMKAPSPEFAKELRDLSGNAQKRPVIEQLLQKAQIRSLAFDLDRKQDPQQSEEVVFSGNNDGKLQLSDITDAFMKKQGLDEILQRDREQAQCAVMKYVKYFQDEKSHAQVDLIEELEKNFPSLKKRIADESVADISPLFLNPSDLSQGALLPELDKFPSLPLHIRTVEQLREYERENTQPIANSGMSLALQNLILEDAELFKVYRKTKEYAQENNVVHADAYKLFAKDDKDENIQEVPVDTKLDRAEIEAADRDSKTPLQYLETAKEEVPQLAATAYLVRQRLGMIVPGKEKVLHISYFEALYRLSPSLFDKDPTLRKLRSILLNRRPENEEAFANGVLTEAGFSKATLGIPKLGSSKELPELWRALLKLQKEILQPFHLWPSSLTAKMGDLDKKEKTALEKALVIGAAHRQIAKVVQGLKRTESAKYHQELCEVGMICKKEPEKKGEIWHEKVVNHSEADHLKKPEGIYNWVSSHIANTNASDTMLAEQRAAERGAALEVFLEVLRNNPSYTLERAVNSLKKSHPKELKVLNDSLYLQKRIEFSALPDQEYNLKRVEFAKELRRGINTEKRDKDHVENNYLVIDGENVQGRHLETYAAAAELEDIAASYPEGVEIFKGNALKPLLDQLSIEDRGWFVEKMKAIQFKGAPIDLKEIHEKLGKYVGVIQYLEEDVKKERKALYEDVESQFLESKDIEAGNFPNLKKIRELSAPPKLGEKPKSKKLMGKLEEKESHEKLSIEGYFTLVRYLLASQKEAQEGHLYEMISQIAGSVFKDRESEKESFIEFASSEIPASIKKEQLSGKFPVSKDARQVLTGYIDYVARIQANPPQPKAAVASRLTGTTEDGFFCPVRKEVENLTAFGALLEVGFPDKADQEEVTRLIKKQIPGEDKEESKKAATAFLFPSISDFFINSAYAEESAPPPSKKSAAAQLIEDRAAFMRLVDASRLSDDNKTKLKTLFDNMHKVAGAVLAKAELGEEMGRPKFNFSGSNAQLEVANFKLHTQGSLKTTLYTGGVMRGFGFLVYGSPAVIAPAGLEFLYSISNWITTKRAGQTVEKFLQPMPGGWYTRLGIGAVVLGGVILSSRSTPIIGRPFAEVKEYGCEQMRTPVPPLSDEAKSYAWEEAPEMAVSAYIAAELSGVTLTGIKGVSNGVTRRGKVLWGGAKARYKSSEAGSKYWDDLHIEGPVDFFRMKGARTHWERLLEQARKSHPNRVWVDSVFERSHREIELELGEVQRKLRDAEEVLKVTQETIGRLSNAGHPIPADMVTTLEMRETAVRIAKAEESEAGKLLISARRVGAMGENYHLSETALEILKPIYERKAFLKQQLRDAKKEIPEIRVKLEKNLSDWRESKLLEWRQERSLSRDYNDPNKIDGVFKERRDKLRAELDKHLENETKAADELAAKENEWQQKIKDTYLKTDEAMQKAAGEEHAQTRWTNTWMTRFPIAMNLYEGVHAVIVSPTDAWDHTVNWFAEKLKLKKPSTKSPAEEGTSDLEDEEG